MEDSIGQREGENPLAPGKQQKPIDISESSRNAKNGSEKEGSGEHSKDGRHQP